MAVKDIMDALRGETLEDIGLKENLAQLVKDIKLIGSELDVLLYTPKKGLEDILRAKVQNALSDVPDVKKVNVKFTETPPQQAQQGAQIPTGQPAFTKRKVPGVKHLIAVGSGKGGVGKSTVAANLALALAKLGYRVGLLDADIYGPSVPTLLGLKGTRATVNERNRIVPAEKFGIKVLSIGFMLPSEDTPVIWRGPMLMKALTQFLFDVDWGELDYLILDLPPGTGDVQLTLAQNVDISGAVVVTTPQDVALADVKKATSMFKEVQIPVLGVIENMAYFICPSDSQKYYIFGKGKTAEFASAYGLKILGSIPIDPEVSERSDKGEPIVVENPESEVAKAFYGIARIVTQELS
ncbi:ATP-binding protein involved in chromosome partitioning [Hydrogenivirga caldilitoris]|uniref:Iron-sulfur cluster carrier protein n=1 Tax=Hydrogenivirga caldilitoris TaxID=246264 RepID=A0A497XSK4_9AQUI|nr:Mrp/NBP35 family ATP-binding protein [Hydrogenivirga caldilitoris]RLJ69903.1 ATP-binding protein involved in chromosome partitioning [Hydrogenivirga caldilitoris]